MSNSFRKQNRYLLTKVVVRLLHPIYQKIVLPFMVASLRRKKQIRVLFVLNELGSWKTEELYLKMRMDSRTLPQLVIVPDLDSEYAYKPLQEYLQDKQYPFQTMSAGETIKKKFHPDIIFYQKPYEGVIDWRFFYTNNLYALFCYVAYSFRNRNFPGLRDVWFFDFTWQLYAENGKVIEESEPIFYTKAQNMVATGIPIMDKLLLDKSLFDNPWKENGKNKKRIIYAPHHTIHAENTRFSSPYDYSTFLEFGEFMLEMAEKYKDETQWSFKPHPVLRSKLNEVWGKKKTDLYYSRWEKLENGQLSDGEYLGLFKHSDAMIHDCGSFKLEYLYTGNPVMYLETREEINDYQNWQTTKALELHYKGNTAKDIEQFILNVIEGVDDMKNERDMFISEFMTPPFGKSACENIINAIFGEAEYSK